MKNIIFILIVILAGIFIYIARPNHTIPTDRLVVFSQEQCPHCHEAMAFIDNQIRPKYPNLKIKILDIANKANMNKLLALVDKQQLNKNTLGTPIIVLGETTLIGWTAATEIKLINAVQRFTRKSPTIASVTKQTSSDTENDSGLCQPGDVENCME